VYSISVESTERIISNNSSERGNIAPSFYFIQNNSADWANSQFPKKYSPPYTPGTQVTDFVSDGKIEFVTAGTITDNILPPPLI
jgi:hypothetical protein